jgi:hypothetical protein
LIGLRPDQGRDALDTIIQEMGSLLNWNEAEKMNQAADFQRKAALGQSYKQRER